MNDTERSRRSRTGRRTNIRRTVPLLLAFVAGAAAVGFVLVMLLPRPGELPVRSAATFEYRYGESEAASLGASPVVTARVEAPGRSTLTITWSSGVETPGERASERLLSSRIYDRHGRIVALPDGSDPGANSGRRTRLWLPPGHRHDGATVRLEDVFGRPARVEGPGVLDGRTTWTLTVHTFSYIYDAETGFLLRWSDGVRDRRLIRAAETEGSGRSLL